MIFSKKLLTIILIVLIAAAGIYFFVLRNGGAGEASSEEGGSEAAENERAQDAPLPVKVAEARVGELLISLRSPGEAVADDQVTIKAEIAGLVKTLNADESRRVRKGDILLELDETEYRLDLESAEADRLKNLSDLLLEKQFDTGDETNPEAEAALKKARDELESARLRYRNGEISQDAFEQASKDFELALIESGEKKEEIMAAAKGLTQAEIRVKKAQIALAKTVIRAPFSGFIYDVKVNLSERISQGTELFSLVNIDRVQVHAKVLESEVGKMRIGRNAELKFSAYPEKNFTGRVTAISPIINPEDKTCNVIISVANPDQEIKPGMHAEVEIVTEIHENKLIIPQDAVLVREGRKLAFVVKDGLAKWRYVTVGLENEDYAEILEGQSSTEGVDEGDLVIIEGHFTLAHDARVRIVE
jgi:RND family efflux transporter MFP subunit